MVGAFVEGSYLQVLLFASFLDFAISFLRDSKDDRVRNAVMAVYTFCEGGSEIMFTITQAVLEYTPVGVFALISVVFAQEGIRVIGSLGKLITSLVISVIYFKYLLCMSCFYLYSSWISASSLPTQKMLCLWPLLPEAATQFYLYL